MGAEIIPFPKVKLPDLGEVVRVEWWRPLTPPETDDLSTASLQAVTVGIVIFASEDRLIVAQTITQGAQHGVLAIPRGAIAEIRSLS